ncbi:MAG: HAMP domain-containing sensor histidine kinase [Candidatus Sericytochromatia bacterium]|nr:HAMP domain-containing sensor histidine kinase [Candidatus Sericytochromatia bacterium]
MRMPPKRPSTAAPIIYGVALVLVTLILTVMYNLALVTDWFRDRQGPIQGLAPTLGLVLGWALGLAVMVGLILFIISLAKQIRLNQQQQNFIDSVTHELKSPLTSLKLHLETMQRRTLTEEQAAQFTCTMLADVDRLDQLIDHVLEAARAEARRRPIAVSPLDLDGHVRDLVERLIQRHGLDGSAVRIEGQVGTIQTDVVALDLALTNLLENAVKYSLDSVQITVRMEAGPRGVTIAVSDTGVGIPKGQLRRIFHRFHRVGNESTRIRQGTGLGLFIAQESVRALRGKLRAASPGENRGSVFTLTLPR